MPELPPEQVAAIRADYEARQLTVHAILARHRITGQQLTQLKLSGGWTPRTRRKGGGSKEPSAAPAPKGQGAPTGGSADRPASSRSRPAPAGRAGGKAPSPAVLARRLLRTFERQIAALEALMADETRQPRAADARLAAAIARGLEQAAKLTTPGGAAGTTRDTAADADTDAARDLEWRRERLRQRVARLVQFSRSGGGDGDA